MKISLNLINHLQSKESFDDFLSEYNDIHERDPAYANTFAGMLELSRDLNHLNTPYLIIGGLAVASYLHQTDEEAFRNWRGTSDIDLVVPNRDLAERVLRKSGYEFRQIQNGKEGVIGRLYDFAKEDNGETTVVGYRQGICDSKGREITREMLNHAAVIPVHGVPIIVPKLKDLVYMKRLANRSKDRLDIKTLKGLVK